MKHTIQVLGIELYAHHGCTEAEQNLGGKYKVDVEMFCDFTSSTGSDDLDDTIDYVAVRNIVREEMAIRSKLIEHVGARIHKRLQDSFEMLNSSKVTVRKLNPPIGGTVSEVSITIEG